MFVDLTFRSAVVMVSPQVNEIWKKWFGLGRLWNKNCHQGFSTNRSEVPIPLQESPFKVSVEDQACLPLINYFHHSLFFVFCTCPGINGMAAPIRPPKRIQRSDGIMSTVRIIPPHPPKKSMETPQ
jgi:hypothetical protein